MFRLWEELGVFEPMERSRLPRKKKNGEPIGGMVCVMCGDASHISHDFAFHRFVAQEVCEAENVHLLTTNGGAIRGGVDSKSNRLGPQPWMRCSEERVAAFVEAERHKSALAIADAMSSITLKEFGILNLCMHVPCGHARLSRMTVGEMIGDSLSFKDQVKDIDRDLAVACFSQVWDGNGGRDMKHIKEKAWHAKAKEGLEREQELLAQA